MGIEPTSEATGARVGLVGIMPPSCGSVQIDRGGSGNDVFGALRAPATMGAYEANPLGALLIYSYELSRNNSFA